MSKQTQLLNDIETHLFEEHNGNYWCVTTFLEILLRKIQNRWGKGNSARMVEVLAEAAYPWRSGLSGWHRHDDWYPDSNVEDTDGESYQRFKGDSCEECYTESGSNCDEDEENGDEEKEDEEDENGDEEKEDEEEVDIKVIQNNFIQACSTGNLKDAQKNYELLIANADHKIMLDYPECEFCHDRGLKCMHNLRVLLYSQELGGIVKGVNIGANSKELEVWLKSMARS
ncbi:MAG: hypothetical protein ABWZ79_05920 [Pedobacter agri]